MRSRIVHTYARTTYHLQVLTLRDEAGVELTLRVTDEHPFHRVSDLAWTPARSLAAGDEVRGDAGVLTVLANVGEHHPQGVRVYNLEVEHDHTYFVLPAHAAGEEADQSPAFLPLDSCYPFRPAGDTGGITRI